MRMRIGFVAVLVWAMNGFAAFHLTWGIPAVSLDSNPPAGDADLSPAIAVDDAGNAVATWSRTTGNGTAEDVWAARYHHASRTWTGAVRISGGGSACRSVVGMDRDGNAVIVWEEGFPTQVYSRVLSAAGVWSPPLSRRPALVCRSLNAQECPQIAVDPEGPALVIWMEVEGGTSSIRSACKSSIRAVWKSLGAISSGAKDAVIGSPVPLAINGSGEAAAVWQQGSEIYGAQYAHGVWMSPVAIGSGVQGSVGIGGTGSALFIWKEGSVIRSRTLFRGSLLAPLTVSNPLFAAQHPCIALDRVGNAVAVFERFDAAGVHKFIAGATLSFNGTAWSSPVDISVPSPASVAAAGYPKLCLNDVGDGVVIWKEFDQDHMIVQGAGYSFGRWSFIRTLSSMKGNSGAPVPSYDLSVAMNLAGAVMAVWPEDPMGKNTQHIKAAPGGQNSHMPEMPGESDLEEPIAALPEVPAAAGPDEKTSHIKVLPGVGIAVAGPLPPMVSVESIPLGIGTGSQTRHRFPAHSDVVNTINWISPGGVAYFNIYRMNPLSMHHFSLIATTEKTRYEDHARTPGEKTIYLITSVDSNGYESGPTAIIIQP